MSFYSNKDRTSSSAPAASDLDEPQAAFVVPTNLDITFAPGELLEFELDFEILPAPDSGVRLELATFLTGSRFDDWLPLEFEVSLDTELDLDNWSDVCEQLEVTLNA